MKGSRHTAQTPRRAIQGSIWWLEPAACPARTAERQGVPKHLCTPKVSPKAKGGARGGVPSGSASRKGGHVSDQPRLTAGIRTPTSTSELYDTMRSRSLSPTLSRPAGHARTVFDLTLGFLLPTCLPASIAPKFGGIPEATNPTPLYRDRETEAQGPEARGKVTQRARHSAGTRSRAFLGSPSRPVQRGAIQRSHL